jgi:hypothetical protein
MIKFAHGRAVVAGAACLLLATASFVVSAVQAQAAATGAGWRVADVYGSGAQNYDPSWPGGLAVPTRVAGWMLWGGCDWPCDPGNPISLVEHWNGHGWARVPASELLGMEPGLVTASSASDAWLFGLFPKGRYDGALHWNGKNWVRRAVPTWLLHANGAGEVDPYLADFGPADLWVFSLGGYIGEKSAYAARYSNGRWTKSYLPDIPESAAAISPNDIWALGQPLSGASTEMLMHWNGRKWSASRFPKQPVAGYPVNLTAVGANDMWVAWSPSEAGVQEYLLHWNGHQWTKVSLPSGRTGYLFAGDGQGGLWVSGFSPAPAYKQIFLHRSSAGRWSTSAVPLRAGESPGNVSELALIPGTRSLWAVGNVYSPGGGTELNRVVIWRYDA